MLPHASDDNKLISRVRGCSAAEPGEGDNEEMFTQGKDVRARPLIVYVAQGSFGDQI